MKFPVYLAIRNLLRHPGRNILYVLGISITAALLLDMILLSSGLSISLEKVLKDMGYEVRVAPRGTLPFETDAQIRNYRELRKRLLQLPSVRSIDAMLGATVAVETHGKSFTTFAVGTDVNRPVFYKIEQGSNISTSQEKYVLINTYLASEKQIQVGDVLKISVPRQSQATGNFERVEVTVAGIAFFYLDAEGQRTLLCPLSLLYDLLDQNDQSPASAILIKLDDSSLADQTARKINTDYPQMSAYTIPTVLKEVDKQLSYFKQFALILGGISLVVTFVLIFIITTISFHDRLGEVALLRAIGLSQRTIFATILFEGILTSIASAIFGFLLGKLVAVYLDAILTSAPGMPEHFSFFVMEPSALMKAGLTLLLTGFFAGLYPASAAVRLPIAQTLREEIL